MIQHEVQCTAFLYEILLLNLSLQITGQNSNYGGGGGGGGGSNAAMFFCRKFGWHNRVAYKKVAMQHVFCDLGN